MPPQQGRSRFWNRNHGKKNGRRPDPAPAAPTLPHEPGPDRSAPISLSENDMFKIACHFEGYSHPGIAPGIVVREELENPDDLRVYNVSEAQQKELWKLEIARLTAAVCNPSIPIHFSGSDAFKVDSKEAHNRLASLADRMYTAFNIAIHDSQGVLYKPFPDLVDAGGHFRASREVLRRFIAMNDQDAEADDGSVSPEASGDGRLDESGQADYFELVNYLTATAARVICKSWSGDLHHKRVLVKLAKMAAKMKVVADDLRGSAAISVQNTPSPSAALQVGFDGNAARGNAPGGSQEAIGMLAGLEGMLGKLGGEKGGAAFSDVHTARRSLTRYYYLEETYLQDSMIQIIKYSMLSLRGVKHLWTSLSTSYEICATVYNTGFDNFPVFIYEDITGEYLGTSADEAINISHGCFQVLNLAVAGISDRRQGSKTSTSTATPPPTSNNAPGSVGTSITWHYIETSDDAASSEAIATSSGVPASAAMRMRLSTMSDVITAMVPLTLASPKVVHLIKELIGYITYLDGRMREEGTPVLYRPVDFKASFCLATQEFQKTWEDSTDRDSVAPLSASLVARDTLLSWQAARPHRTRTVEVDKELLVLPIAHHDTEGRKDHEDEDRHIQQSLRKLQRATKKMDEWVFEENGVRVRCDLYVGTVSTAAALLALSGIAAGITIRDRLPGVDPFNITTFCWVLAAFIILIAKSMRVASWTWWDFLHRQVLCRSVSELRAVTGIDDQLILARLLYDESASPLLTQGPYNAVFTRKATAGGGFAIDRPIGIRTMLLSGLIMLQVQAPYYGKYLVCLDLRKGDAFSAILRARNSNVDEDQLIVSNRLPNKPGSRTGSRIVLKRDVASWSRVNGVYGQKDAVFC